MFFGEDLIRDYSPLHCPQMLEGQYFLEKGTDLIYKLHFGNKESLYFGAFDEDSKFSDAFEIRVNGIVKSASFPESDADNSFFYLGDYQNEDVTVTLYIRKFMRCASLNLFGVDRSRLFELCKEKKTACLNVKGGGLYGYCQADEPCTLFLSLPYSDNFTIKVNGKKIGYRRCFTGFTSFDLDRGNNEISITFMPKGFKLGVLLSCLGLILSVFYVK